MFRLDRPNMALNDPRVAGNPPPGGGLPPRRRFQMWNTWDIRADETREHIVEWVATVARGAKGGHLKHLVLSGHGSPAHLSVGQGFGRADLRLFDAWKGLVEKIWLPNCTVAFIGDAPERDGNLFCSELAKRIGGYVVAATELQCDPASDIPPDLMTSFEGLVLSYGPEGNVTWSSRNTSMWMRTAPDGTQQCVSVPN